MLSFSASDQHREGPTASLAEPERDAPYEGSRFGDVWSAVCEDPYAVLPQDRKRLRDVLRYETLAGIYRASNRTLQNHHDLLPPFDKRVHPIGICLRGTWTISDPSPYTGYFRQGSRGLLIARASENMGETRAHRLRFLALAAKLYPTLDPEHREPLCPANFVMNECLLGSRTQHYLDANLSTDLLPAHRWPDSPIKLATGLLIAFCFAFADRASHVAQPLHRQLYPIARLGQGEAEPIRAPRSLRLRPLEGHPRIDQPDFREELARALRIAPVRYAIDVSEEFTYVRARSYAQIGEVEFTEAVASYGGDHRLHFHHAPFRSASRRVSP